MSEDGTIIAVSDTNNCVSIIDIQRGKTGEVSTVLRGHDGPITWISISRKLNLIVTASEDGSGGYELHV